METQVMKKMSIFIVEYFVKVSNRQTVFGGLYSIYVNEDHKEEK